MANRVNQAAAPAKKSDIATRELLLIAAGDLMTERRSTDVSLSDIAQKSGLNSALVKYYFGSKAGLFLALIRRALGPSIEQLAHLDAMPISPQEKLRIHISGMVNSYFRFPYVNQLMHQMLADDPLEYGPIIAEEFGKPAAEAQRRILEAGVQAGCFKPVDPIFFYFHIAGACDQLFYGRYQLEHIFGINTIDETLKRQYVEHLYGLVTSGMLITKDRPNDN